MTPENGYQPGDADASLLAKVDAAFIVGQLANLSGPLKEQLANELGEALWSVQRSRALKDSKQHVNTRFLHNGLEVSTNLSGTTVGLTGGKGQFDIVNYVGGGMWIDSASNARQVNVSVGAGSDCMFDYLVSSCFASLNGFTEGQTFTTLSGCTFKGYSTVGGAITAMAAANADAVLAICRGTYSESISGVPQSGKSWTIYGAGVAHTYIANTGNSTTTFNVGSMSGGSIVSFSNLTFDQGGNTGCTSLSSSNNGIIDIASCRFLLGSTTGKGTDIVNTVGFRIANTTFSGTGTAISESGGIAPISFANIVDNTFTCTNGIRFIGNRITMTGNVFSVTGDAVLGDTNGANELIFTSNTLTIATGRTGVQLVGTQPFNNIVENNTFRLSGSAIGVDVSGCTSNHQGGNISNNSFFGGASTVGIKLDTKYQYSSILNNVFRSFTSGNEITGTAGTGTVGAHNISDAGVIADFGSPVGHAGSGSGGAAPNGEPFVTIGNSSNLSAERALTAGNGVGFTDGGANSTVTMKLVDLTANWTQAGVFDISHAGNLTVLKHGAFGTTAIAAANNVMALAETFVSPSAVATALNATPTFNASGGNVSVALQALSSTLTLTADGSPRSFSGIVTGQRSNATIFSNVTAADVRNFEAVAAAVGTITDRYGLRVLNATGAGSVTNQYGVYIESMTKGGTLNRAIYSAGGDSVHAGSFRFGSTTAPSTTVDVTGTTTSDLYHLRTPTTLTIATGTVTATQSSHKIDTEASAASDDLDTINGTSADRLLFISPANDARTVVIKHNTGNILCVGNADLTMDDAHDFAILWYDGTLAKWRALMGTAGGGGGTNALLDGSNHTDTVAQTVSRGSLIYGNSTPKWDELVIGSSGKFLYSDGTDASWRTPLYTDVGAASKTRILRIPAQDWWPSTTSGCGRTLYNGSSNAVDIPTLDFDATSIEYAQTVVRLDNWDGGTVTAVFVWMTASTTTTHTCHWALAGGAYGDGETLDAALGTAGTVDDNVVNATANQVLISGATGSITIANATAGDWVRLRVHRDPTDGNDDLNVDARLLEVRVTYTEA